MAPGFSFIRATAVLALVLASTEAYADPVKGDVRVTTDAGYARIVFRLAEDVPAKVTMSGAVAIVTFEKPVAVPADALNTMAPGYISAARLDPDGTAVRIALARKVKINSIPAGERFFVDLLPDGWAGMPPSLPQEVIDELARRTREAEKILRQQQLAAKPRFDMAVRVKVGTQPTFTRYMIQLPPFTNIAPEEKPDRLTLNFDQPLKFDLADARATLPPTLTGIDAMLDDDTAALNFMIKGRPKIRAFREDKTYVIDISTADQAEAAGLPGQQIVVAGPPKPVPSPSPAIAEPETVPAAAEPVRPVATEPPKAAAAPAQPKAPNGAQAAVPPKEGRGFAAALSASALPSVPAARATETPIVPSAAPVPPNMMAGEKAVPLPQAKVKAAIAEAPSADPTAPITVAVHSQGSSLRIDFPYAAATPAAVFRRGDAVWAVFDSPAPLNIAALREEKSIKRAALSSGRDGETVLRLTFDKHQLASFMPEGTGWALIIGDSVVEPTTPVQVARSIVGKGRSSITIPFNEPRALHRVEDPEVGDTLFVVTALGPARGFLKQQEFVELRALASAHGIVVQPFADDVTAEIAADKVVITRPGGLSLSSASLNRDNSTSTAFMPMMFDPQTWGFDRQAKFAQRESELMNRAAMAPEPKRRAARLDLARFYLAHDMAAEAKGVLDVVTADERENDGPTGTVLKAVASVMLDRPDEALKELAAPQIGNNADAPIWRAMAYAKQGRFAEARDGFRNVEAAVGALPIELQRVFKREALRCSIEVRDFGGASSILNDFESLGVPPDLAPSLAVLSGRVEEGLGHNADALAAYRRAAASKDRRAAAAGHLRDLVLRSKLGDLKDKDLVDEIERLTISWRGDDTEAEGLQVLAIHYTRDRRYRDAFHVMRTALLAHPHSELTRRIQDEAANTFDSLFMTAEADALPAIEALGLFYDYRELTPIGRRGDEMIRRLADRLVAVDLLDQAAELLQHQSDHRLKGAARAQVATRLATIYLMNRKPDRALVTLQQSRSSELASDLREQRLLLEARALSDIGRHELALEIISGMKGREVLRLRADIMWTAKKWREAAELLELLYGERWKNATVLTKSERIDVMRTAIAYALADEQIGLARFRQKYLAKMADGPDQRAFDVVTAPIGSNSSEFRAVAGAIANTSTLDAFLAELKQRYPEKPEPADDTARGQDAAPATNERSASDRNVDSTPTGSISRARSRR
jgi:hypothetical protein